MHRVRERSQLIHHKYGEGGVVFYSNQIMFCECQNIVNIQFGHFTAVQLVYNPFSQFISLAQLYSQLQLGLWSDPIALCVPTYT